MQHSFQKFSRGEFSYQNKGGRGRPPIDNDQIKIFVELDLCKTVRDLSEERHASKTTAVEHFNLIGKSKSLE